MHQRLLPARVLLLTTLLLAPAAGLRAQGQNNFQRTNPQLLAAMAEVVAKPSEYTVRVECSDKDAALGTIVRPDGWILTKASELKTEAVCKLKDGREFPAKVIGVSKDYDLAMLKIETSGLPAAEWKKATGVEVGSWLATPGLGKEPVAVGVVSVGKRNMPRGASRGVQPNPNGGFLGVTMQDSEDGGVKVVNVRANSPAEKAGIRDHDVIVAINDKEIQTRDDMLEVLGKYKAGDEVAIKLLRADKEMTLKAKLIRRPPNFDYLGISVEDAGSEGIRVVEVAPGMTGGRAGLKVDDVIKGVNSHPVRDTESLAKALGDLRPGDELTFRVVREGAEKELKVTMPRRLPDFDRGAFQNAMGGQLSERRGGFPVILQHDTVLKPSDCGGPVVDLDGKAVGINIARAGRTETYAIPSEVIETLIPEFIAGKFPALALPKAISPAERLKAAEAMKVKALADKAAAEKLLKDAEEEIRKAKAALEAEQKKKEESKKDEKKPEPKKD
jgi:S1-C subfamily serine protease